MSASRAITNKEKRLLTRLIETELVDHKKELTRIKNKLKQVALLCRLFNKTVEITYESEGQGELNIRTKVWLSTCKKIVLKNGVSIPTEKIKEVKVL